MKGIGVNAKKEERKISSGNFRQISLTPNCLSSILTALGVYLSDRKECRKENQFGLSFPGDPDGQ